MELLELGMQKPKWSWSLYGQPGWFYSTFSSIAARRVSETLTEVQRVPTWAAGGNVVVRPSSGLVMGADWRYNRAMRQVQNLAGLFVQDTLRLNNRVDLLLGARGDVWQNRATHGGFHPRGGLVVRAAEKITLRASGYTGFRAPTINELYRPFRAGNALTQPNPNLRDERLWGGEAGADFYPTGSLLVRLNFFRNMLTDAVSNFTISSTPALILRQRRNLVGAVIQGFEAETQWRYGTHLRARASYLYSDARVQDSPLRLPQTARHQGAFSLNYDGPVLLVADVRAASYQFDDDVNKFLMAGYPLVNLSARRVVTPRVELFLSVENVGGRAYAVAATPLLQLGTPRLVHGGVHLSWKK
jgi:outer membrane receptor protein involved in Fe transport